MNTPRKKDANGCVWLIFTLIVGSIGFGASVIILDFSPILLFILSFGVAIFLANGIIGRPRLMSVVINLVIVGVFLVLAVLGFTFVFGLVAPETETAAVFNEDESIEQTFIIENGQQIPVYTSNRVWRDNFGNSFQAALTVRDRDFQQLRDYLANYNPQSSYNFWGNLYDYMERKDRPAMDLILDAFRTIQQEKNLNKMEFAEMVVSCIQDIPYSYVFQEECLPPDNYEYSIRTLLEQCPECCIGNIPFGIQNPTSFMRNLKGDCDTRTVIIYLVLKHFGYDVAILNSDHYRHSILGINLPASGQYKVYRGKRYVVWETTAKYFKVGNLPATYSDIAYWDVVLTSK